MPNLLQAVKLRPSVLDDSSKDDVLEINNLFKGQIDPERFFSESYFTDGINQLLTTAFGRFEGKDDHGIIKLTQNMGGGKTHSMITLGLLAKHPEYRERFLGANHFDGEVKVVGFSGRQVDTELGVWGEIAKQLGKEEEFKSYYNPQFKAPGNDAWVNMLKGQPTLILLDELPPYLVNAKSVSVGNSDLSVVTATALANLFNAIKDNELNNVMIVIADLAGSWSEGTDIIKEVLDNIRSELTRVSLNLTPVRNQSNELVEILKKKLFESLPAEDQIRATAESYKSVLNEAKQMGLTNVDPNVEYTRIVESYPFHPSFIDLYNRFKDNSGFQQTRGVIRLVRTMVKDIHDNKNEITLITPQDINLSNTRLLTEVEQLNGSLTPAIRHDIYTQDGTSVAQLNDKQTGGTVTQDMARLILVASLATTHGSLKGLNQSEITATLVHPGVDVQQIKPSLELLVSQAWYMAIDKDNRHFFQQNQNLNARLTELVGSYDDEAARKEAKKYLENELKPVRNDCYQSVQIFPGVDEINVESKKVTLIVTEPSTLTTDLSAELRDYWQQHPFKNRFLFLSGERQTWNNMISVFKELKGIDVIIEDMKDNRVSENDPQFKNAIDKRDKIYMNITSAVRETFTTVYFPRNDGSGDRLDRADINFQFANNSFNAEEQITSVLKDEMKFTEDIESVNFREKVEAKLFGPAQQEIQWGDLLGNAARNCSWSWHHPKALDALKSRAIAEGQWRDNGGFIEKGPFAKESTGVEILKRDYDRDSGETILKISPKYGDKVYVDTNENVSEASKLVENTEFFKVKNRTNYFLCVDSTGAHETGEVVRYNTPFVINHEFSNHGSGLQLTLKVNNEAELRYTTDSSDPRDNGGIYDSPISIPEGARYVRVVAHVGDDYGDIEELAVPQTDGTVEVGDHQPVAFTQSLQTSDNTQTYQLIEELEQGHTKAELTSIALKIGNDPDKFVVMSIGEGVEFTGEDVRKLIDQMRAVLSASKEDITVEIKTRKLNFASGVSFKQYASANNIDITKLNPNEIQQSQA